MFWALASRGRGEVVACRGDRLSGHRSGRLTRHAGLLLVGFVEGVHHPAAALVDVFPAWVVDGDKLQEAVADAVDDHGFDMLLFVEVGIVSFQAHILPLTEASTVGLAKARGENECVVGKRILLATHHVHLGEALENGFWREERREEVIAGEVRLVLFADVE